MGMVDRITSQRPTTMTMTENGTDTDTDKQQLITVPRAEPIPNKALVIEDVTQQLPSTFSSNRVLQEQYGVVIRSQSQSHSKTATSAPTSTSTSNPPTLTTDIALKLRIANGTHTALAHVMALSGLTRTDVLSEHTTNEHPM